MTPDVPVHVLRVRARRGRRQRIPVVGGRPGCRRSRQSRYPLMVKGGVQVERGAVRGEAVENRRAVVEEVDARRAGAARRSAPSPGYCRRSPAALSPARAEPVHVVDDEHDTPEKTSLRGRRRSAWLSGTVHESRAGNRDQCLGPAEGDVKTRDGGDHVGDRPARRPDAVAMITPTPGGTLGSCREPQFAEQIARRRAGDVGSVRYLALGEPEKLQPGSTDTPPTKFRHAPNFVIGAAVTTCLFFFSVRLISSSSQPSVSVP